MTDLQTWTRAEITAELLRVGTLVELTDRKVEILRLVAQGLTNVEIYKKLHLSESMVKVHLRQAAEKIGARVNDRAHIIAVAYERGVLQRGDAGAVSRG